MKILKKLSLVSTAKGYGEIFKKKSKEKRHEHGQAMKIRAKFVKRRREARLLDFLKKRTLCSINANYLKTLVYTFQVGVSRALSAFRAVLDTKEADNLNSVGTNPCHEKHLSLVKLLAMKKRKLSRISRIVSRNQNLGNSSIKLQPYQY